MFLHISLKIRLHLFSIKGMTKKGQPLYRQCRIPSVLGHLLKTHKYLALFDWIYKSALCEKIFSSDNTHILSVDSNEKDIPVIKSLILSKNFISY